MEKINKYIKGLLDKNEKAAKKKRIIEPIGGEGEMSDDEMVNRELKRRSAFSAGAGKKPRNTKATSHPNESDEDTVTRLGFQSKMQQGHYKKVKTKKK